MLGQSAAAGAVELNGQEGGGDLLSFFMLFHLDRLLSVIRGEVVPPSAAEAELAAEASVWSGHRCSLCGIEHFGRFISCLRPWCSKLWLIADSNRTSHESPLACLSSAVLCGIGGKSASCF